MRHPLTFGVISALLATGFVWILSANVCPIKAVPLKESVHPKTASFASFLIAKSDAAVERKPTGLESKGTKTGTGSSRLPKNLYVSSVSWSRKRRFNLERNLALDNNSCVKEAVYVAENRLDPAALFANIGWEKTTRLGSGNALTSASPTFVPIQVPTITYCSVEAKERPHSVQPLASFEHPPQPRIMDAEAVCTNAKSIGTTSQCQGVWECSTGKMPINLMLAQTDAIFPMVNPVSIRPVAARFDKALIQSVAAKIQYPNDAQTSVANIDFNQFKSSIVATPQETLFNPWDLLSAIKPQIALLQATANQVVANSSQVWNDSQQRMSCSEQEFAMNLPTQSEMIQTGSNWSASSGQAIRGESELAADKLSFLELEIISAACEVLHVDPAFCGNDPFFNPYQPIVDANRKVGSGLAMADPFAYDGAKKILAGSSFKVPVLDTNGNVATAKAMQNLVAQGADNLVWRSQDMIGKFGATIQSIPVQRAADFMVDKTIGKLQKVDVDQMLANIPGWQDRAPGSGPRFYVPVKPVRFQKRNTQMVPQVAPIRPMRPESETQKSNLIEAIMVKPLEKALEWEVFSGKSLGTVINQIVALMQQASLQDSNGKFNERQQFEEAIVSQQESDDWGMTALMAGQCVSFANAQSAIAMDVRSLNVDGAVASDLRAEAEAEAGKSVIQPIATASNIGLLAGINKLQTAISDQIRSWNHRAVQLSDTVTGLHLHRNDAIERIVLQHFDSIKR